MNKFIEQELKKCKIAKVESVSDTEFLIRKVSEQDSSNITQGGCYVIELAKYITHPSPNFTLASNWNRGIVPKSECLKCTVTQIMGKMIKIDGCGYDIENDKDLNDSYIGLWLPLGGVNVKEKL